MPLTKRFMINADDAEDNNVPNNDSLPKNMLQPSMLENDGDVLDPYDRYEEDIAILAEACIKTYRFFIDWNRIQPEESKIDEQAFEGPLRLQRSLFVQLQISSLVTISQTRARMEFMRRTQARGSAALRDSVTTSVRASWAVSWSAICRACWSIWER